MINEEDWAALAAAADRRRSGAAWRRLYPDSNHDIYIAVTRPGDHRALWYDFPSYVLPDDRLLPALRHVAVEVRDRELDGWSRCEIKLESRDLGAVFSRLVDDISSAVAVTSSDGAGVRALFDRLERWRRLLQGGSGGGLNLAERRGLFGELHVLRQFLDGGIPPIRVLSAWTGPLNRHQDFQFPHAAVEVKTTSAKNPQALVVASERELDPTGVNSLFLVHVSLDERHGGRGASLPAVAAELQARLEHDAPAASLLNERLQSAGLLPEHHDLYREPRYTVRRQQTFEVGPGFPCITEATLPAGVGDVRYQIQTGALAPHSREWNVVMTAVKGAQ
jgi:hypothetical protein